jgi:GTP-binding protein HflX
VEELHRAKDRVLLVAVEFSARRAALLPSALLAREVRKLAEPAPATQAREVPAAGELLMEFRELVLSAGAEIAGEFVQRRPKPDPATLIGSGKVRELAGVVAATGANAALFDHDLTPTQLRNLEAALPCRVLDRTQLILDIFARHARTREGQLQVELAQLEYLLPRLAGRGKAMSQLGGGIGTRGPGETQLETDRRKLQRRIVQLKHDLEAVRRVRGQQRQRREAVPVPTVALVGYTNAGKSTLFNALTQAGVVESSRMFATLDPKLKAVVLPSRRKVLLSDTVGFIRNLPHTLVSSFRATLEEVQKAEVLLHVRDASSPARDEHKAEVEKVLAELEAVNKPCIEVMNKVDLLSAEERETAASGGGVLVSARMREGLDALLARLDEALVGDPVMEQTMIVPQSRGDVLAALEAGAVIREREFRDNAVRMQLAGPASLLGRYREFREKAKTDRASGSGGDSQMPGPSDPEPGHRW